MNDRLQASRLDTSSVLSETMLMWLTTAGVSAALPEEANHHGVTEDTERSRRRAAARDFIILRRSELMTWTDRYSYPYRPNRRMMKPSSALPDSIRDAAHLDDLLSTPTEPAIDAARAL